MSAELEKAEAAFQTLQSDSCHKDVLLKLADEHQQARADQGLAALLESL